MYNIFFILSSFALIVLDSFSKNCAIKSLAGKEVKKLGLLNLNYVENRGAAFGILQNQKIFLSIITQLAVSATIYYFFFASSTKSDWRLKLSLTLIFSGTMGNFIDRIFRGCVIDFIEFSFVKFPVFNLADIFLTVGFAILCLVTVSH